MQRKGWYLVGYDIANPRRLIKVHRLLRRYGVALQRSVFLVQGTEPQINQLLDRVTALMACQEDDLRAYPIEHPAEVWTMGCNPMARLPVVIFGDENRPESAKVKKSWWRRLLRM